MNQIYNPVIPLNAPIPGGMHVGRIVRIQGFVPISSHKFAINLYSMGDIALHICPKFLKGRIVRNSVHHGSWGHKEKHGGMPLHRGQQFTITILCEHHHFKIAVNEHHFTEFKHRLPLNSVTNLGIDGQVSITHVLFEGGVPTAPYPPYPGVPYPTHPPHHGIVGAIHNVLHHGHHHDHHGHHGGHSPNHGHHGGHSPNHGHHGGHSPHHGHHHDSHSHHDFGHHGHH